MPTLIGVFIAEQRRLAGLSRSQLASRIGYTNVNKGSRRIVELEQWGEARSDLLPRIVAALTLDADQVRALVDEDTRIAHDAWERWVSAPVAPTLRYRVIPAIWVMERLPDGLSREAGIEHARVRAMETGKTYVLVWTRREEVWCYGNGKVLVMEMGFGQVAGPATMIR